MRLIVSFTLLLISHLTLSQVNCHFKVNGSITDTEGDNLPGATIWIESLKRGTTSLPDGTFTLNELCEGEYTLHIKFLGYQDRLVVVPIPAKSTLKIIMQANVSVLHDIVIEGEHTQQHSLTQAVSTLSVQQLDANKGKSLGEMMKAIPGVSAVATGPAIFKPVIHGLHSQRVLILNNGIRQEGQQWGIEHAPEIDTYIASEVEVVKGSETVRYGADAIGGVIILNTPPLHATAGIGGELNLGLMSNGRMGVFSGMLEGGFKKFERWGWRLQGSAKKAGDFHAADYNLSNTGVEELNFSGMVGFQKPTKVLEVYFSSFNTRLGILRSAHTGNPGDLQNSIENEQPWYIEDFTYDINNPHQRINHQLLKVKANWNMERLGKLNVQYGGQYNQRKEYDIRRGGRDGKPALSLELFSNVVDVSLDHEKGNWTGSIGLTGSMKTNNNIPGTGIKPLIPNYNQYSGGAFLIEKVRRNKWLMETGLRFDHQYLQVLIRDDNQALFKPVFNFNYFSGSLGLSYYFSERARFSNNFGISSRPPHVAELYSEGLNHTTGVIEVGIMRQGGELLTDQSLVKTEVSAKWVSAFQVIGEKISVDLSAYVNGMNNYVFLKPDGSRYTIRGYSLVFQYQQTDALLAGSDFSINLDITKRMSYTGKLSYLYAKDLANNDVLPFIPPVHFENSVSYKWPKAGQLTDVYALASLSTFLKQYRAPITVYPEDVPDYTGDKTYDFMPAPDGYNLLTLECGAKIPIGNHKLSIILSGENLLNVSYRDYMNRLRYYADDTGRNFSLRLKYDFHSH